MGIRGLQTLVKEKSPSIFRSYRLSGTRIVIDGSNLLYAIHMKIRERVPLSHGGEYELLRDKCKLFLQNLKKCDCRPYVIFDGCSDLDDRKFEEHVTRFEKRIRGAKLGFANEYYQNFMPLLAKKLIIQVLKEEKVPFVFSPFESDRYIAALACEWQSPIMSTDSDFYIMDGGGGVIHLEYLKWEETIETNGGQHFMEAKIYHIDEFCTALKVRKELLPLFATLAGNDYVQLSNVHVPNLVGGNWSKSHLMNLLEWVGRQSTIQDACNNMYKHNPHLKEFDENIRLSLDAYNINHDIHREIAHYFKLQCSMPDLQLCTVIGAPSWVAKAHQQGSMSSLCLNVLNKRRYFSQIDFEDYKKSSSWMPAKFAFSVLCGIILADKCHGGYTPNQRCVVFIRNGETYKKLVISPLECLPGYGKLPSLSKVPSLSKAERQNLILRVLAPSLRIDAVNTFPSDYQLALLALRYCTNRKKNLMTNRQINALLLRWVLMYAKTQPGWRRPLKFERDLAQKEEELRRGMPDPNDAHGFAQWQQCFVIAASLNETLQFPLHSCSDISLIFNGLTLNAICAMPPETPFVEQEAHMYMSMRRFVIGNTEQRLKHEMGIESEYDLCSDEESDYDEENFRFEPNEISIRKKERKSQYKRQYKEGPKQLESHKQKKHPHAHKMLRFRDNYECEED